MSERIVLSSLSFRHHLVMLDIRTGTKCFLCWCKAEGVGRFWLNRVEAVDELETRKRMNKLTNLTSRVDLPCTDVSRVDVLLATKVKTSFRSGMLRVSAYSAGYVERNVVVGATPRIL
jgi:hypothetical protein